MHGKQIGDDLVAAQEAYSNLRLPVMDLVTEAPQHDDYVCHLKEIFELPVNHGEGEEGGEGDDEDDPDA
ncbi:hypothetical protein Hanom_Chr06g00522621 [Helianthus anomalus]